MTQPPQRPAWIDDLLAALTPLRGSDIDVAKAQEIKNKHMPSKIYRYRGCSKYSWANLQDDTTWMGAGHLYNDPFDSGFVVDLAPVLAMAAQDAVDRMLGSSRLPWLDKAKAALIREAKDPFKKLIEFVVGQGQRPSQQDASKLAAVLDFVPRLFREHGKVPDLGALHQRSMYLSAFTEDNANLLMWSHYAGEHQGFCIEYDISTLPADDQVRLLLYPVIYSDTRFEAADYVVQSIKDKSDFNNLFGLVASIHKSSDWAYEKEWRLVFPWGEQGAGMNYKMPTPSHVYLGARIKDDDAAHTIKICRAKSIPVSKMRLSDTHYALEAVPIQQ